MERKIRMQSRAAEWRKVLGGFLCLLLVLLLPGMIAFSARGIAKNMNPSKYAGGYKISKYIGEREIEGAVYIGRGTKEINGKQVTCDYYFAKKWYNFVSYELLEFEFDSYCFVCVFLDEDRKIESMKVTSALSNELRENAINIYRQRTSEITYGNIVLLLCEWWWFVYLMLLSAF